MVKGISLLVSYAACRFIDLIRHPAGLEIIRRNNALSSGGN